MRLLLVDGHYYLYRSFYAIRGLTNARGEPTNAIFGFSKALRRMLADLSPDRAAVIWDAGLPARRVTLQPEYKQNRSEMPDDLRPQEEWLQKHVPLFGPRSLWSEGTEADDLIASYARAARGAGMEVVIATNDKDIQQIVAPGVAIYAPGKSTQGEAGFALLREEDIRERWGVDPSGIAEILALTGDASDNIPGVPGVGPKTATSLIQKFGTVEALLSNMAAVESATLRDKLALWTERIRDNREMVRLDDDLPLPEPLDALRIVPSYPELISALRACDFKSLTTEIEREAALSSGSQGELFAN